MKRDGVNVFVFSVSMAARKIKGIQPCTSLMSRGNVCYWLPSLLSGFSTKLIVACDVETFNPIDRTSSAEITDMLQSLGVVRTYQLLGIDNQAD